MLEMQRIFMFNAKHKLSRGNPCLSFYTDKCKRRQPQSYKRYSLYNKIVETVEFIVKLDLQVDIC